MFIYKYLEMNDTKINFSFILLTSNVPVQIMQIYLYRYMYPNWEPLHYRSMHGSNITRDIFINERKR